MIRNNYKNSIERNPYYWLFREYWQTTFGRKAKKKVDNFDSEKVYNRRKKYIPPNLLFFGLFWGPVLFGFLALLIVILFSSLNVEFFYENLFLSIAKNKQAATEISKLFDSGIVVAGKINIDSLGQLFSRTIYENNSYYFDVFKNLSLDKRVFTKMFELVFTLPELFFSIKFIILLPILVGILLPPILASTFAIIYFNYGYWKYYKIRRNQQWSWMQENHQEKCKQRTQLYLLSYEDYLGIKDMKAVLLDDDLYKETGGHNAFGFSFKTFITTSKKQIDHIVKTGTLTKELWEETFSFGLGQSDIISKGYDESCEMLKKTKYNSQAFALGQKGHNADKPEVAQFFETHKYGVVLVGKTSAYCEGISGSGKGQSQVLPELFGNLTSKEKVSVLLTFKANLEEFKLIEYITKKRKLDYWKLRLDAPTQSMSYNPLSFSFYFNELFRQLAYGEPQHITDFTPADYENSFTLSWKWKTPADLQEKYLLESKKPNDEKDDEIIKEYIELRQVYKQTHLFNKKAVLDFIAQTEDSDAIYKFEKLKDYENMSDSLFLTAIKFYESDKFKILNCSHPILFFGYKKYDYWTADVKQSTRDWIQVGNWAFVNQEEYEQNKKTRASWAKDTAIDLLDKFVETLVKVAGASTSGDQKVWTDWAKACVLFFLLAFLDLAEYSPLFTEEYFNLPSYGLWFTKMCENAPDDRTPAFRQQFLEEAKSTVLISMPAIEKAITTYGTEEGQWNGIKGTASTLLSKFGPASPIKTIILRNDISPLELPVKPTLCLVVPDQNPTASANALMPAFCDIVSTATQILMSERSVEQACPINTLFLLDEAGSGFPPPADLIINTLALGRSAKKFLVLYYQTMGQVSRSRYGDQAEELLKTIQSAKLRKLVATDTANAKFWEEQFGQMTYSSNTYSPATHGSSGDEGAQALKTRLAEAGIAGVQEKTEALFSTTELAALKMETAICRYEAFKPYVSVSPFFFRSDVMWKWIKNINETMTEEELNNVPCQVLADKWEEDYYLPFFDAFNIVKNNTSNSNSWLISESSFSDFDLKKYFKPEPDEIIDILYPKDEFPLFQFGDENDTNNEDVLSGQKILNKPSKEQILEDEQAEQKILNEIADEPLDNFTNEVLELSEERRKTTIHSSFSLTDDNESLPKSPIKIKEEWEAEQEEEFSKPTPPPQIINKTPSQQVRNKITISASIDNQFFTNIIPDKEINKKINRKEEPNIIQEADDDDNW